VTLTLEERLKVLAEQISALIHSRHSCLSLSALSVAFLRQHGYALKPEAYECSSLEQLIKCLCRSVAVSTHITRQTVVLMSSQDMLSVQEK
jgi:hypothetical protein